MKVKSSLLMVFVLFLGKVYNVSRYMDFHPGGIDELMKGAGKDATSLFNSVRGNFLITELYFVLKYEYYIQYLCEEFLKVLDAELDI